MITKNLNSCALLCAALYFTIGCSSYDPGIKTREGAALGAAAGAVLGAVIGHQSDESGDGAAVGAGAGAIIGGILGSAQDKRELEERAAQAQIREERLAQQAAILEAETERDIARGFSVTDQEVLEAEQRAQAAKNELLSVQKQRAEAIERQRRIEAAEAETKAAKAKASELMTY